jgi:hypothetical protein
LYIEGAFGSLFMFRLLLISLSFASVYLVNAQYSDSIRLNDLRVLASHNSYKAKPDQRVLRFLSRFKKRLGNDLNPIQLDYGHETLENQLNVHGILGFELDVCPDPKGGRYVRRRLNAFVPGIRQKSKVKALKQPGFKLLHIADVDYESNYTTFKEALVALHNWSEQHPRHLPLFVNIEIKRDAPGNHSKTLHFLGFRKALTVDSIDLKALDDEILSVFPVSDNRLFAPINLKEGFSSVNERLKTNGWPPLNECLGKVFFILDGDIEQQYTNDFTKGISRPMFVYGEPDAPATAFVIKNDPIGKEEEIRALTNLYIVRTRSDAGTLEARANDYSRWDACIHSQAQIISTDYYRPDPAIGSFYVQLSHHLDPYMNQVFLREK